MRLLTSSIALFLSVAAFAQVKLTGTVYGVSDGDTIKIRAQDGKEMRVRFHGIDAPESKQAFGQKSKQTLSDLIYRKQVVVQVVDVDRYGRSVGKVYLQDKARTYVNLRMVQTGMAWWYDRYAPNDRDLRDAMMVARREKKGLWADPKAIAPWEYRKAQRSK